MQVHLIWGSVSVSLDGTLDCVQSELATVRKCLCALILLRLR